MNVRSGKLKTELKILSFLGGACVFFSSSIAIADHHEGHAAATNEVVESTTKKAENAVSDSMLSKTIKKTEVAKDAARQHAERANKAAEEAEQAALDAADIKSDHADQAMQHGYHQESD
jgi:hypothetical protein